MQFWVLGPANHTAWHTEGSQRTVCTHNTDDGTMTIIVIVTITCPHSGLKLK